MANQINVTDLGVYSEVDGLSLLISDLGLYVESLEFTNEIDVTTLGVYTEVIGNSLLIDSVGIYVESSVPNVTFALFYNDYSFCNVNSIKFKQSVTNVNVDTLLDVAGRKIPIIPTWQIDVGGFWCVELAESIGNLGNVDLKLLSAIITDKRTKRTYEFKNTESFITTYNTDINIDNAMIYAVTFVGSGNLTFGEYT